MCKHTLLCQPPLFPIISYCQTLCTFFVGNQTDASVELRMSAKKVFIKSSHSLQVSRVQKTSVFEKVVQLHGNYLISWNLKTSDFLKTHDIDYYLGSSAFPRAPTS